MSILAEITAYDPTAAQQVTLYYSHGLTGAPVIDGHLWKDRLKGDLNFGMEIFQDGFESAGSAPSIGRLAVVIADGELDEITGYNFTGFRIRIWTGADTDFADYTLRYSGVCKDMEFSQDLLQLTLSDFSTQFDAPLGTPVFAGTGGAEGTSDLKDVLKPACFGQVFNMEPVLVDATDLIYQVHFREIEAIDGVFDLAAELTSDGDTADLAAWTPVAGKYKTDLSKGLFRLGAKPAGLITADVRGDSNGGYVSSAGDLVVRVLQFADTENITVDPGVITALNTANSAPCSLQIKAALNVSQVLDALLRSIGGYWYVDWLGNLQLGVVEFGASAASLDDSEVSGLQRVATRPPVWQLKHSCNPTYRVHSQSEIVSTADWNTLANKPTDEEIFNSSVAVRNLLNSFATEQVDYADDTYQGFWEGGLMALSDIGLAPGDRFTVSGYCWSDENFPSGVSIRFFDSSQTYVSRSNAPEVAAIIPTRTNISGTIPANTVYIDISYVNSTRLDAGRDGSITMHGKDAMLTKGDILYDYVAPVITQYGDLGGDKPPSDATSGLYLTRAVHTSLQHWVSDSTGNNFIKDHPSGLYTLETVADAPLGKTVLQAAAPGTTGLYMLSDKVEIGPSNTYEIDGYLRRLDGDGYTYLAVIFYDEDGAVISGSGYGAAGWPNTGSWNYWGIYAALGLAPTTWTYYRLVFGTGSPIEIPTTARSMRVGMIASLSAPTQSSTIQMQGFRPRLTTVDQEAVSNNLWPYPYLKVKDDVYTRAGQQQPIRPAGVRGTYDNADKGSVMYAPDGALRLASTTDTQMGMALLAFKVNPKSTYTIKFQRRYQPYEGYSTAPNLGFYARMLEKDSELAAGIKYLSINTSEDPGDVVAATRQLSGYHDNQTPPIAYSEVTFTYTPTSTAKWASLIFLNWAGMGLLALDIKDIEIVENAPKSLTDLDATQDSKLNGIEAGADVTGNNTAASISGQGALATKSSVGTNDISNNAVTNRWQAGVPAFPFYLSTSWTNLATVSATSTGNGELLFWLYFASLLAFDDDGAILQLRVTRNGTVIWGPKTVYDFSTSGIEDDSFSASPVMKVSSINGTYTYAFQILKTGGTAVKVQDAGMTIAEVKK